MGDGNRDAGAAGAEEDVQPSAGDDPVDQFGGDSDVEFRRRTLERICARRATLTVAFVLSGMIFVVALVLILVADLSSATTVIAVADAAIAGTVCLASAVVLRLCRRTRRGE